MAKLNQIIAVEKGIKSKAYSELTELNKMVLKPELFNGFVKNYQKKNEESEDLPSETKRVQCSAPEMLRSMGRVLTELLNVTARKDYTNCGASADVVVDGKVVVKGAPVSYLLFLEKQITDIRTFVENIPVLDSGEDWSKDTNSGLFKAKEVATHRTKKVQRPIVLYDATPEHPAQTNLITEDVLAGHWIQVKQSGAMPKPGKEALLGRIEKLLHAVKYAREEANSAPEVAGALNVGNNVLNYILED